MCVSNSQFVDTIKTKTKPNFSVTTIINLHVFLFYFKSIQVLKTRPSLLLFLILEAPGWMTLINHKLASELICVTHHN